MSFDFAKFLASKPATPDSKSTLMLLLCGPQGGGKSYAGGTFGVPTLYLHGTGEGHGPVQAATQSFKLYQKDFITGVNWDIDEKGEPRGPDAAYQFLLDCLSSPDLPKHFGAVVVDGLSDLTFNLIRNTRKYNQLILTEKGVVNNFKEGPAVLDLLQPILKAITVLQSKSVLTMTTMLLDVQQMGANGEISLAKPYLPTYGLTTAIIPQFDDIAVISYVSAADGLEPDHYLQFDGSLKRISKNAKTEKIEKVMMINPRITGAEAPAIASANLAKLAKFKKDAFNARKQK